MLTVVITLAIITAVFGVVLAFGGLLGWGISKLVQLSALSGVDRFMGSMFGAARGILLVAVAVIGAQFAGFDNDDWWMQSRLIPQFEAVADWIKVMATGGVFTPGSRARDTQFGRCSSALCHERCLSVTIRKRKALPHDSLWEFVPNIV